MNAVEHITDKFFDGSLTDFALWLGHNRRVLTNWKARGGHIPTKQQIIILDKSDRTNKGITPADFFPTRLPEKVAAR